MRGGFSVLGKNEMVNRIRWLLMPVGWIRRGCFDWSGAIECWRIAFGPGPVNWFER